MSTRTRRSIQIFIAAVVAYTQILQCKEPDEVRKKNGGFLQKNSVNDSYAAMTVNNIFSYYTNNGDGSLNPFTGDGGFELINANRGITIFEEGFVWGGRHMKDSLIKVGGSTYNHGLQAGKILTAGTSTSAPIAEPAGLLKNRIFRVRPDVGPGESFSSVKEKITATDVALLSKYQSVSEQTIYDQYVADWNEWPGSDGAPYTDVNNNGVYEPQIDIPGVPGADQTIWYVANDLDADRVYHNSGSPVIGLEFQRTIWAYNIPGPLGNTIFQKNILINKSGYDIDSMYVAQWADPDLGGGLGYTDDFIGCDTTLSLGFVYNGDETDGFFGTAVPSMGFDFLQGPLVPGVASDSGKHFGKYIQGKKNLGMTSFNFFIGSNATYTDPRLQDYRGTLEWYNLMQGLIGRTGDPYIDPTTGNITKFVMAGDPLTGQGWVEGLIAPPGDRRMALCSGPFTVSNGDTQEIVVGAIVAKGEDRLESVRMLKVFDKSVQWMYNNNYEGPASIVPPKLSIAEFDKKIILEWSEFTALNKTEQSINGGYSFQGYNVYQSADGSAIGAKRVATFDKKDGIRKIFDTVYDENLGGFVTIPVQYGEDTGLQRYVTIQNNYLTSDQTELKPLVNFQKYYFAVTGYNYSADPDAYPRSFESTPQFISVIPQPPQPGTVYPYKGGDSIYVLHSGNSDGFVKVNVVNPKAVKNHQYAIEFDSAGGATTWKLHDKTANSIVYEKMSQLTVGDAPLSYSMDGLQIDVYTSQSGIKTFMHVAGPSGEIDPPSYAAFAINALGFPPLNSDPLGTGTPFNDRPSSDWGGGAWGVNQGEVANGSYSTFKSVVFRNDNLSRFGMSDYEIRFTPAGGKAFVVTPNSAVINVPFELWQTGSGTPDDPSDDYRMIPWITDADSNGQFNLTALDHILSGGNNDPYTDWITWMDPNPKMPGTAGYDAFVAAGAGYDRTQGTGGEVMSGMVLVNFNGGSVSDPTYPANINSTMPASGNVIRILTAKPNNVFDSFTFTPLASLFSSEQVKKDIEKVNVFPNPYFATNAVQNLGGLPHVTFTHLPRNATISIVNLGGIRVRKLVKDDDSQTLTWDLMNESGWLIAAGMYVAYIDMGVYGSKILKFAVIPERPSR